MGLNVAKLESELGQKLGEIVGNFFCGFGGKTGELEAELEVKSWGKIKGKRMQNWGRVKI